MHNLFSAFILVACFVIAQARAQDISRGAICSYYPGDAVDKPSGLLKLQCAEGLQCCDTYINKEKTQKISICLESCPKYATDRNSDADAPTDDDPSPPCKGRRVKKYRVDPKTGKRILIEDNCYAT